MPAESASPRARVSAIHLRAPYLRPRSMGGDVAHPLCRAPVTGWAGPASASLPMSDAIGRVTCSDCRRLQAAGGIKARQAELTTMLIERPRECRRAWKARAKAAGWRP